MITFKTKHLPIIIALAAALVVTTTYTTGASAAGDPLIPAPDPITDPDIPSAPSAPGPLGRRLLRLPFLPVDANIIFAMDGSMSLSERQNVEMRKAARRTLKLLDIRRNPDINVGVVMFDKKSRVLCDLSRDERDLFGCVGSVRQRYGTDIVAGLHTAYLELIEQREHAGIALGKDEIILLFTDGHHKDGCFDVIEEARSIKGNGVRIIAVSVGSHADGKCLSDVVTSPVDLYTISTSR